MVQNIMCQSRLTGLALMHLHSNVDDKRVLHSLDSLNDGRILLTFD